MSDIYDVLNNKTSDSFDKNSWGEQKKAERNSAYSLVSSTLSEMVNDGQKFKTYLSVQSRLDKYSVNNAILITAQNPNATKLKDYGHWKEAGTSVRSKEKGIVILEPAGEYTKQDGTIATSYNAKKVFDVSQTYLKDKSSPPRDERTILKALIQNSPVEIKAVDTLHSESIGAFYNAEDNSVYVKRGLDNNTFFKSVSQELAHAYFAQNGDYKREDCGFKAYCVSYMLTNRYGLDSSSFDFSRLPENFKNGDENSVKSTLSDVRVCLNEVTDRMYRNLEQSKPNKNYER